MITRFSAALTALILLSACHHTPEAAVKAASQDTTMSQAIVTVSPELKKLHFDLDKDPSCGMPLRYGLLDSTVYKGKLLGFCSKECKEAFLKDPNSAVVKIK